MIIESKDVDRLMLHPQLQVVTVSTNYSYDAEIRHQPIVSPCCLEIVEAEVAPSNAVCPVE